MRRELDERARPEIRLQIHSEVTAVVETAADHVAAEEKRPRLGRPKIRVDVEPMIPPGVYGHFPSDLERRRHILEIVENAQIDFVGGTRGDAGIKTVLARL